MKRFAAVLLCTGLLAATTYTVHAQDEEAIAVSRLAVKLLQETAEEGESVLLSPYSILSALAMTANGASGKTLEEMESVLGLSMDHWNTYLADLRQNDSSQSLKEANAIWLKEDDTLQIRDFFLETVNTWYDADIFSAAIDENTCKEINQWVSDRTDAMIPEILDEVPEDAIAYLVNALAFEDTWVAPYTSENVFESDFTAWDGSEENGDFLHSKEYYYLSDNGAEGVLKYYEDGKYAFAALLPEEDLTTYIQSLTGEKLHQILSQPEECDVQLSMPVFHTEYSTELSEVLKDLGMPSAFSDDDADFSELGTSKLGNIYLNRVLHRCAMDVDSDGTRAGAATVVEMIAETALEQTEQPKIITLNRPFVYLVVDTEAEIPIFIGTLTHLSGDF
jgi:serpin B